MFISKPRFWQFVGILMMAAFASLNLPGHAFPFAPIRDTTANRNESFKPLAPFIVPLGTFNVALGKPVASSDDAPIIGSLPLITDGDKAAEEEHWVELGPGTQWVQIDLRMQARIFGLHIWHYHGEPRVYRDVVVQISDDPTFSKGVRTVYNNDQNNSSGLGKGTNKEYFEFYQGFRIDTRGKNYEGVSGRYVRLYSKGNSSDPQNQYIEVEVIGKPLGAPPPLKDIEARRSRGELKPWDSGLPENYSLWPDSEKKAPVQRPAEFLVPVDASNIRDDASLTLTVPTKIQNNGRWSMQLDFGEPREIYGLRFSDSYCDDTVHYALTVITADDSAFTKNVRTLFKEGTSHTEQRKDSKFDPNKFPIPDGGLLIDVRGSEIRGISARYLRFARSSSRLQLDVCVNATIIGKAKPNRPAGQPGLMLWETKFPAPPYW